MPQLNKRGHSISIENSSLVRWLRLRCRPAVTNLRGIFFAFLDCIDLFLHLLMQVMQKTFQVNEPNASRCTFTA